MLCIVLESMVLYCFDSHSNVYIVLHRNIVKLNTSVHFIALSYCEYKILYSRV